MVRRLVPLVVAALVVAADQAAKTWALHHTVVPRHVFGPLTLALTFNSGAAFGLGRGITPVVEAVVVALVAGLLIFGRRAALHATIPAMIGMGLLIGGAVGNLVDRVVRDHHGAVIDFIAALRIGAHDRWPIFNLADSAIVIGAIILAITFSRKRPTASTTTTAPTTTSAEISGDPSTPTPASSPMPGSSPTPDQSAS